MSLPNECVREDQLVLLLEGRLSNADTDSVTAHAGDCESCRVLLSALAMEAMAQRTSGAGVDTHTTMADGSLAHRSGVVTTSTLATEHPWTLTARATVGGRYQVVRPIGRGGMGEVYEVRDQDLDVRVALKILAPRVVDRAGFLTRFHQELRLSRQVTHRNVCRAFDLGSDAKALGSQAADYYTMELVPGESLRERLARGPMTIDEVRPILAQLAAGLRAAHGAGVVHCDLKPGNVLLETRPDGVRAVITDFGLARSIVELGADGTGDQAGTPRYMAPEQLRGKPPTPATDLYALGLMLFEMLTGQDAFGGRGQDPHTRLVAPPPSPRDLVPTLPARWDAAIRRCLAIDAAERYAAVGELVAALDAPPVAPPRRRVASWTLGAGIAVAVAATAFTIAREGADDRPMPRARVAIVAASAGGEPQNARLSRAFVDELTDELAGEDRLIVVRASDDQARALAAVDGSAEAELEQLAQALGARFVVTGLIDAQGTMRLTLVDPAGAPPQVLAEGPLRAAEVDELVATAADALRAEVGVPPGSARLPPIDGLPADPTSRQTVLAARVAMEDFRLAEARQLLEAGVARDLNDARLHAELAMVLSRLGESSRAAGELTHAQALARTASRPVRSWIDLAAAKLSEDAPAALVALERIRDRSPDLPYVRLSWLSGLVDSGRHDEALDALGRERLRWPADDPRLDMIEASVLMARQPAAALALLDRARTIAVASEREQYVAAIDEGRAEVLLQLGQFEACLALATDVRARARVFRFPALELRALKAKAGAQTWLGRLDEADATLSESAAIATQLDNADLLADVWNDRAVVLQRRNMRPESTAALEEARRLLGDRGNLNLQVQVETNLAILYHQTGRHEEATAALRAVIARTARTGLWEQENAARRTLVAVEIASGDAASAEVQAEALWRANEQQRDPDVRAAALGLLATARLTRGRVDDALTLSTETLAIADLSDSERAQQLVERGLVLGARDDVASALEAFAEGGRLAAANHNPRLALAAAVASASLEVASGKPARGLARAKALLAGPGAGASAEIRAELAVAIATASLNLGESEKARRALADVTSASLDQQHSWSVAITQAAVQNATGHAPEAVVALDAIIAAAQKRGFAEVEVSAKLARAEALAVGREAALVDAEDQARRLGFRLLARRAAEVRATAPGVTLCPRRTGRGRARRRCP